MGTGGGPSRFCPLSPLEEQVVALLSYEATTDGVAAKTFGVARKGGRENSPSASTSRSPPELSFTLDDDTIEYVNEESQPNSSTANAAKTTNIPRGKKNYISLLETQIENQAAYQESSVEVLQEINKNLETLIKQNKQRFKLELMKFQLEKNKLELMKRRI